MKFSLLLLFSLGALAFDKDLKPVTDKVPYEFNLLFESMKLEIKSPAEKLRLVGLSKDINDNLGNLSREHIMMLMKTEIIKSTLEYRFEKVRKLDVSTTLLTRLQEDFTKKKTYLNSFSQFLWQSIIAELSYRQKAGLLTAATFSASTFDGGKRLEAARFERYLTYLSPWIDKLDALDASAFNALTKELGWEILKHISERAVLFKRYASSAQTETNTTLINIPGKLLELKPEDIKRMKNDLPLTLEEQSKKERSEAVEDLEKVTPLDMSPISDDVANELERKTKSSP